MYYITIGLYLYILIQVLLVFVAIHAIQKEYIDNNIPKGSDLYDRICSGTMQTDYNKCIGFTISFILLMPLVFTPRTQYEEYITIAGVIGYFVNIVLGWQMFNTKNALIYGVLCGILLLPITETIKAAINI